MAEMGSGGGARLPVEILEIVFANLDKPSLGRCMSASRLAYHLAVPHLYHTLIIDLGKATNPLYYQGIPIAKGIELDVSSRKRESGGLRDGERDRAGMGEDQPAGKADVQPGGLKKLLRRLLGRRRPVTEVRPTYLQRGAMSHPTIPSPANTPSAATSLSHPDPTLVSPISTLPDRFSFTRHLTITSHDHTQCRHFPPLLMPNLETLRIRAPPSERFLNACHCPHSDDEYQCSHIPGCSCPLLTQLRPQRLVMGGSSTCLSGFAAGLWPTSPTFPPSFVNDLTIFMGKRVMARDYDLTAHSDHPFIIILPPTVEHLTLVDISYQQYPDDVPHPQWFWRKLAWACSGHAQVVEVVGLRNMPDFAAAMEEFRLCLREQMGEVAGNERWESVVFTSKEEYDAREGVEVEPRSPAFIWERPNHLKALSSGGSR